MKLDVKNVHVLWKRGDIRSDMTAYLYFETDKKLTAAVATHVEKRFHYERSLLYLVPLTKKACYTCKNPTYEAKMCKLH